MLLICCFAFALLINQILEKFTEHVARERDRDIHRFSREQTGEGLLLQKEALRDTAILRSLYVNEYTPSDAGQG